MSELAPQLFSIADRISRYCYEQDSNIVNLTAVYSQFHRDEQPIARELIDSINGLTQRDALATLNDIVIEKYVRKGEKSSKIQKHHSRLKEYTQDLIRDDITDLSDDIDTIEGIIRIRPNARNEKEESEFTSFISELFSASSPYKALTNKRVLEFEKKHRKLLRLINRGQRLFKSNKLLEALNIFSAVIKELAHDEKATPIHIYYFAWSLHLIGNIYYVIGDIYEAEDYYEQSISSKFTLQKLPVHFLHLTQVKLFCIQAFEVEPDNNDSLRMIKKIKGFLESIKSSIDSATNELLIFNLIGDIYFILGHAYYRSNDYVNSKKYFDKAYKSAIAIDDKVGAMKVLMFYYASALNDNHDEYSRRIVNLASQRSSVQKDPYLSNFIRRYKDVLVEQRCFDLIELLSN